MNDSLNVIEQIKLKLSQFLLSFSQIKRANIKSAPTNQIETKPHNTWERKEFVKLCILKLPVLSHSETEKLCISVKINFPLKVHFPRPFLLQPHTLPAHFFCSLILKVHFPRPFLLQPHTLNTSSRPFHATVPLRMRRTLK